MSVQAVLLYGNAPFSSRQVKTLPEHPKGGSPCLSVYLAVLCPLGRVSFTCPVDSADLWAGEQWSTLLAPEHKTIKYGWYLEVRPPHSTSPVVGGHQECGAL